MVYSKFITSRSTSPLLNLTADYLKVEIYSVQKGD